MIDLLQYKPLSFTDCFRPKTIGIGRDAKVCRCGTCDSCKQSRRSATSVLLDQEIKNWKYCIFFTLTYSDKWVPKVEVQLTASHRVRLVPVGRSADLLPYVPINVDLDFYRYVDGISYRYDVRKTSDNLFVPKLNGQDNPNIFGVLCYRDVQLFKKRFIQNYFRYVKKQSPEIFRNGTPKSQFFYCGEYGSKFYRPHFHLLFMFDKKELVSDLGVFRDFVYNSWGQRKRCSHGFNRYTFEPFADYGRFSTEFETDQFPNFSFVQTSSSVSSYVSSYVSSSSSLPRLLNFAPWRPRPVSPHGKYGTFGAHEDTTKEFVKKVVSARYGETNGLHLHDFMRHVDEVYDEKRQSFISIAVPYSVGVVRSVFCKPYGYSTLSRLCFEGLLQKVYNFVCSEFREMGFESPLDFLNSMSCKNACRGAFTLFDFEYFDSNSTWLFVRNGIRFMLLYKDVAQISSIHDYMSLFDYVHQTLTPQMRLASFYSEQDFFAVNMPSVSLIQFYDNVPSSLAPWLLDWLHTFPNVTGRLMIDDVFELTHQDELNRIFITRKKNILFSHKKHHSRIIL